MAKRRRRSTGVIDKLPDEQRYAVEQMLLAGEPYRDVVIYLAGQDVTLSQMSVCRYAKQYLAAVEQLKLAQENMRMLMEELEKYPDLDTGEAILRLASQNVFNAISAVPSEDWEGLDPTKLLKEATGLVRAASYKRKIDAGLKTEREAALEANQNLLLDVLAKKHPELYEQIVRAIKVEKQEGLV
ncbi:MAG: phage protein Gp27 family protein [Candidatus Fimivivens sp.]